MPEVIEFSTKISKFENFSTSKGRRFLKFPLFAFDISSFFSRDTLEGKSENTKIAVKIKAELLPKSEKLVSFLSLGHTEQAATFAARVAHSLASCPSGKENLPRARRGSSSGKRNGEPKGFGMSYAPLGSCARLSRGCQCWPELSRLPTRNYVYATVNCSSRTRTLSAATQREQRSIGTHQKVKLKNDRNVRRH